MIGRTSIRIRLLAWAVAVVVLALIVTGFSLEAIFTRHLERRIGQELETHLSQIVSGLRFDAESRLSLTREPVDPRFTRIFGGLYWQVSDRTSGAQLKSRSLWDTELALPDDHLAPGDVHSHTIDGPDNGRLLVHEVLVVLASGNGDHRLRVSVAIDRAEITALSTGFAWDLGAVLGLLGLLLIIGLIIQVSRGLRPVRAVLDGVAAVRAGKMRRIDQTNVPEEVAPLVDEVNALLDAQDRDMVRARDRAADLAHGMKTPLTALGADIDRLRMRGQTDIADDIAELALRMGRHMDRELARARLRHGRAADPVPLSRHVDAILRTLRRTPKGAAIVLEQRIDGQPTVLIDPDDLNDLIGNLVENALRHANRQVLVTASQSGGWTTVSIQDDGDGMDDAHLATARQRGGRLDSGGSGAGLGLAIVADILEVCGGELDFGRSPLGGLNASMTIPAGSRAVAADT
ncbi:signal transduction histidine kinase [Hoeflea marina]|uniref:histidine kinase n=1 Tax=Hoeflea marina TaxID=274592 RepID=A0A317PXS7_9HYPH|nr:HAMP domain-containing sensor histidine kinase [Hoeflea marina]PWW04300.1 signal transduction histidine kinase [Hoeflea marina]